MERSGRWSLLQAEILAQLRKGQVDSVSDLARTLEKSRPAVSRALKTLSEQGIVHRHGRAWNLTESGKAEANKAVAKLQESTADIVEIAGERFRAMSRAGLDDALSASMTSLIGSSLSDGAAAMFMRDSAIHGLASITETMLPNGSALEALSSMRSMHGTLADIAGLCALNGAPTQLESLTMSGQALGLALSEAAGRPIIENAAAELLNSIGSTTAFETARGLGSISGEFAAGELARDLGLSMADRLRETIDIGPRLSSDYTALLASDYSALAKSVDLITAGRDEWPASFVDSAAVLAGWEEHLTSAMLSDHEANAAKLGEIMSGLAHIDLAEPLLSDALRVYGLNSERIHTPTYWIPPVEPVASVEDARARAIMARRRRINDAADTLVALEETIRDLVAVLLSQCHGPAWWKRGVPPKIRQECEQRKSQRERVGGLSHDPIAYTYTSELKDIILKGDNWGLVFSPIFRNKSQVEASFLWIEPVRKDIAHSRPSSDRDYKNFKFAATWLMDAAADTLDQDPEIDAAD